MVSTCGSPHCSVCQCAVCLSSSVSVHITHKLTLLCVSDVSVCMVKCRSYSVYCVISVYSVSVV